MHTGTYANNPQKRDAAAQDRAARIAAKRTEIAARITKLQDVTQ